MPPRDPRAGDAPEEVVTSDAGAPAAPQDGEWQAAWETEENYWFENFSSRPYAMGPDYFDRFRPAYRYGYDSARRSLGSSFEEAEPDLAQGWSSYAHRNEPTAWDEVKDAVRDAWNRVTGRA